MSPRHAFPLFLLFSLAALQSGCATSLDTERARVRHTLAGSQALASEIQTWRRGLAGRPAGTVVETIQGFQDRARNCLEDLAEAPEPAAAGVDLTATKQALTSLADFDTSKFNEASDTSRNSLLDQFAGLAISVESSARRAQAMFG